MPNTIPRWAIIAHGGAKDIATADETTNREGLKKVIEAGARMLQENASALDVAEHVVKLLELDPAYNAGLYGCVRNEEGMVELDASIMDGKTLAIGAIASVEDFEHPVSIARALLKEQEIFLVGRGAAKFAKQRGFKTAQPHPSDTNPGCDTVGCVVLDRHGSVAAATSTGGLEKTKAGRVGDVPLPGCGFYADDLRGGVSASGDGESIARVLLASEVMQRLVRMSPDEATQAALKQLERVGGEAGLIAIDKEGNIGWGHSSPHFAVGMADHANPVPRVYLKKDEE